MSDGERLIHPAYRWDKRRVNGWELSLRPRIDPCGRASDPGEGVPVRRLIGIVLAAGLVGLVLGLVSSATADDTGQAAAAKVEFGPSLGTEEVFEILREQAVHID